MARQDTRHAGHSRAGGCSDVVNVRNVAVALGPHGHASYPVEDRQRSGFGSVSAQPSEGRYFDRRTEAL